MNDSRAKRPNEEHILQHVGRWKTNLEEVENTHGGLRLTTMELAASTTNNVNSIQNEKI